MDEIMVEKKYTFNGYGFPVTVYNAPMRKVFGEWSLDVNLNELNRAVAEELVRAKGPLTGYELRFIRDLMGLTLADLGKRLGVTHATVLSWEKRETGTTGMKRGMESYLRILLQREFPDSGASGEFLDELVDRPEAGHHSVELDLSTASAW